MVYDPDAGEYAPKDSPYCVARWERRGDGHAGDDICGAPATERVTGIDLCGYHFERLSAWGAWVLPRREHQEKRRALRESAKTLRKEVAAAEAERERIREAERARYSVVYFIRRVSDGMVKIGTTTSFDNRMKALQIAHGELQILLTMSGGRALETEMHRKFDVYRRPRTELFAPANPLLIWIYRQRVNATYRDGQVGEAVKADAILALAHAAPTDEKLQWRRGRAVWPPAQAA